jgi:ABC-type multidrug transport system fused ATPase/permease subunit
MRTMPNSVYTYIFRYSKWQQIVVIGLTLALLPLSPVPLELQRRLLDDAVANKDVDLLIWLAGLYVLALLVAAGIKFAMRVQREMISARIVHALRRSVYYHIYTVTPPALLKASKGGDDVVDEGTVVSLLSSETEKLGGFAGSAISGPLLQIGMLCVVLGYMFYIEPAVAAIALALYSPQFVLVPIFQARMNRLAGEKAITVRELGNFIVDNVEPDVSGLERLGGPIRDLVGSYGSITDARMRYRILLDSFPEGMDCDVPEPMPKVMWQGTST